MSRKFQVKAVPSTWLENNGRRLDCGPYVSGAIEARELLRQFTTSPLESVTAGHGGGIYNGPQFARNYVKDSRFGVPFLTTSSLLQTDLSSVSYLSRKDAESPKLRYLRITEGMTLITCSGTIGRMTYARKDMEGMWSNQDIMKVVSNRECISPGYLFAFLSGRYGLPMVLNGTYGAIIQHIEPNHIADLPVPRLGNVEAIAHELVQRAADNRVLASQLIAEAIAKVMENLEMSVDDRYTSTERFSVTMQSSHLLLKRMDSYYYSQDAITARDQFDRACRNHGAANIGDVAEVWIPDIFKRQYVDDPIFGCSYFTGKEIYELAPSSDQFLKSSVAQEYRLLLTTGMILIQDSGQVSGLIGRPVMVGKSLDGCACTNNMVRLIAPDLADNGYLFAVLSTVYGTRLLKREASGSSIPHLEEGRIKRMSIPWPKRSIRERIGKQIVEAMELRDTAVDCESQARLLIEKKIEEGGR